MNTHFNVELTDDPYKDGLHRIMIRIHQKGQLPGRIMTTLALLRKHWNEKKTYGAWVRKSHPESAVLNSKIETELNRVKAQFEAWRVDSPGLTPKQAVDRFRKPQSDQFFKLADEVIRQLKASDELAISTVLMYQSRIHTFRQWAGEELPVSRLTSDLVRKYQEYLKKKTIQAGTVNDHLLCLQAVFTRAMALLHMTRKKALALSPFMEVESLTVDERSGRTKLVGGKLERVKNLEAPRIINYGRPVSIQPEQGLLAWMTAYTLAGMRRSDLLLMRYNWFETDETGRATWIRYTMHKTGRTVSFQVSEVSWSLLRVWWKAQARPTDYVLPYLKNDAEYARYPTRAALRKAPEEVRSALKNRIGHIGTQLNRAIRTYTKAAGITEDVTMHTARHSFGVLAVRKMREGKPINLLDLQHWFGHSSILTTQRYAVEVDREIQGEAMVSIWEDAVKEVKQVE
ncbi:tyrosine-type recombinase/integrase [Larkinella humicola]|uniref:Tyrosine-type recombinase/integrase n=1 Tax=Larkinella humicola TaxID=2607654 RepID=A0A5N1JLC5_9BACT|nr:tyrosine-type recombinase/integrase [Larkinella humicola]KAA9357285.1 tyrosine-type recombinase/integrase [Larkinella humicola]